MKIIRWFFSHTFLIVLIIAVIYSYMYWGNLLGQGTPAGKALAFLSDEFETVDEFVTAVREKQARREAETDLAARGARDTVEQEPSEAVVADSGTGVNELVQTPASVSYSHNQQRVDQDSAGNIEPQMAATEAGTEVDAVEQSDEEPVAEMAPADGGQDTAQAATQAASAGAPAGGDTQAEPSAKDDRFVSEEISEQLDNVDGRGQIIDHTKSNDMVRQEWIKARVAFYRRDYRQSEKSYLKVIDSTHGNFDAYGELGNVYFNQGKSKQAAQAYFDAASILVRRGEKMRAHSLLKLLHRLDAGKAEELKRMIEAPAG